MSTNCIYCEENNSSEHFCCEICGVGMCEDCYNNEEEHSRHYQEITDSCESNEEVNRILDACNNKEPDYLCQCCLAKILGDEVIEVKKFSAWKIVEKRNYVANDKNHYSCSWDLCNGEMIIKSYGKLKYADSDFEAIKKYETPKDIVVSLIKAIIRSLDVFGCAQFSYEDQFFDIFESSEGGYEYSIYPNDLDLIFEDGELIDDEVADGGHCESENTMNVLSWLFPISSIIEAYELTPRGLKESTI